MTHLSDEQIRGDVKKKTPAQATQADAIEFGTFTPEQLEDVLREDVQALKDEKMLHGMDILGFVFITKTGELKKVC